MEISKVPFGTYKGEPVTKYILTNDNGVQVGILDFAVLLQSFKVPTKNGGKADMILTSENLDEFTNNGFCTNRLIGRVAGLKLQMVSSVLTVMITKSNKMKVKMLFMVELMVFIVTFGMLIARKQLMILFPSLLV